MAIYGYEYIVMPSIKALAVLDSRSFAVRVSHREKYGGFAHAAHNFSLANQILVFAIETIEDHGVALNAFVRSAAAAGQ